jgi:hypothetical protein
VVHKNYSQANSLIKSGVLMSGVLMSPLRTQASSEDVPATDARALALREGADENADATVDGDFGGDVATVDGDYDYAMDNESEEYSKTSTPKPLLQNLYSKTSTPKPLLQNL